MAQLAVIMSSEEQKLFKGMQRVIGQQKRMDDGWKRVQRTSQRSTSSGERFVSRQLAGIKSMVAGYASLTAVIGTVRTALQQTQQLEAQAGQRISEAFSGLGQLGQLTTDPRQLRALIQEAKDIRATGGVENLDQAARLVFALTSAGLEGEGRRLFSRLAISGLVSTPAESARAAATLQTAFGRQEAGTIRDIVSKAFGVSEFAPATAEQILTGAARPAGAARLLGITDEEVLGALAVVSKGTESVEIASTQLAAFFTALGKLSGQSLDTQRNVLLNDQQVAKLSDERRANLRRLDFRGLSLRESVEAVRGLPGGRRLLGEVRAQRGFDVLALNLATVDQATAAARTAEQTDRVGTQLEQFRNIVELATEAERRKAEAVTEAETTDKGLANLRAEILKQEFLRQAEVQRRRGGLDRFSPFATSLAAGTARLILGDQGFVEAAQRFAPPAVQARLRELERLEQQQQLAEQRKQTQLLQSIDAKQQPPAARTRQRTPRPPANTNQQRAQQARANRAE